MLDALTCQDDRTTTPSRPATSQRRRTTRLAAWLTCLASGAGALHAHDVLPVGAMSLRPGTSDYVYVIDCCGCPADITVSTSNPDAVTITALDMTTGFPILGDGESVTVPDRVDQVFLAHASDLVAGQTTVTLDVCWIGQDFPAATGCNENNCGAPLQITVTVEPISRVTAAAPASGLAKDPVNTATGEFVLPEPLDFDLGGKPAVRFGRLYSSGLVNSGFPAGPLGPNWRHTYEWQLFETGNQVEILTNGGQTIRFEQGYFESGWSLVEGDTAPYQLQEVSTVYSLCDPWSGLIYTFGAVGELASVRDRNGNTHTLTYASGRLAQVTDSIGRTLAFTYTGAGELETVSDGTRTATYSYTGGLLTGVNDTTGFDTTYAYDAGQPALALMASRMRPEGNTTSAQVYDGQGRVTSQTAAGETTTFAYDRGAGTTTITDADTNDAVHTHGSQANLTNLVDESGAAIASGFDAASQRTSVVDREGRSSSWVFDPVSRRVTRITDANGAVTRYTYTPQVQDGFTYHELTAVVRADGTAESFAYDTRGNLESWTDPAGEVWSYTYDTAGRALSATNPAGAVSTYTYDGDGTLLTHAIDGETTTFAYDALRRLDTVTHPDMTTVQYAYDARDRLTSYTDELGRTRAMVYDDNGNLTSCTNRAGETWTFGYDELDRLETVTDPLAHSVTQTYDALGRASGFTGGDGDTLAFTRDARGRVSSLTDGAGEAWTRSYDDEGFETARTSPLGHTTTFTANALGRPSGFTTPLGNTTTFAHDALGRLTSVVDPLGKTTTFTYDERGDARTVTLPSGARSTFELDALRLLTRATDPGSNDWLFGNDERGRNTSKTDPLGNVTTYAYDERERLERITFPAALGSVDLTYDDAGRKVQESFSDATTRDFTYDEVGRLETAEAMAVTRDAAGRLASSNGIAFTRTDAGRLETVTLAAGKTITYAYDGRGLLETVTDWLGGTTTFGYDSAGRLTSQERPNGVTSTTTYDNDDRVLSITEETLSGNLAELTFVRNAQGHLASAVRNVPLEALPTLGETATSFDAAGQIVGATYDELGRLTADTGRTFTWSLGGALTSYTHAGGTVTLTYDGLGNVVQRVEGAQTRDYVWNYGLGLPSISIVRDGSTDLAYHVHTPAGILLYTVSAADVPSHYHYDEMGNTLFLTDASGAVTDSYAYTPFGELLDSTGSAENPFTFGGAFGVMAESAAGLYRMRARYYDARTQRFLTRDPIEATDPRGVNPYQYANGNPLAYVDPRGTTAVAPVDIRSRQIRVETHFVTVSDDFLEEIGVDFHGLAGLVPDPPTGPIQGAFLRGIDSPGSSAATLEVGGGPLGQIGLLQPDLSDFSVALSRSASPQILSRPSFRTSGIDLEVRPTITANNSIVMTVRSLPSRRPYTLKRVPGVHSEAVDKLRRQYLRRRGEGAITINGVPGPGSTLSRVRTRVSLPDRGSLLVGGLLRMDESVDETRVPLLGDLPVLGRLFRSSPSPSSRDGLRIFVTANIVRGEE